MINLTKDGILCDLCEKESKGQFKYYSVNFKQVDVDKNRSNLIIDSVADLDMCEDCFAKLKDQALKTLTEINKKRALNVKGNGKK